MLNESLENGELIQRRIKKKEKSGMNVEQSRRMVQEKNERRGLVSGSAWGVSPRHELLDLTRCHICSFSQVYEDLNKAFSLVEPTT